MVRNTISSLVLQGTIIICGFVLPRAILQYFGSEINGLVNSITQFLTVIAFLELGVGTVVQSSLYQPLAQRDYDIQSKIYVSAQKFFYKLGQILLCYILFLIVAYPLISGNKFSFLYTATLIIVMSISSFAQYYFGIVNSLLLMADQRGYIQYNIQTVTLILNTVCCVLMIVGGLSIHLVKLATSLLYLIRPIYLNWYVGRRYKINKKIKYDKEPIKQKWNGVAQHIATIILDGTDTIVLTAFSNLSSVSIYSVYYLVISGIKQLFNAITNGIQALLGDLYARNDKKKLMQVFELTEWTVHTFTVLIMGCVAFLITPFVQVYTTGLTDADYNQPLFGFVISVAYAVYCLRLPYHMMTKASGKYKETQNCYITSAIVNILVSVLFVNRYGIIGVAVGTLVAMLIQTVWLAHYNAKYIIDTSVNSFVKQILVDVVTISVASVISYKINISDMTYLMWLVMALKIFAIWSASIIIVNLLLYRERVFYIINKVFCLKF